MGFGGGCASPALVVAMCLWRKQVRVLTLVLKLRSSSHSLLVHAREAAHVVFATCCRPVNHLAYRLHSQVMSLLGLFRRSGALHSSV